MATEVREQRFNIFVHTFWRFSPERWASISIIKGSGETFGARSQDTTSLSLPVKVDLSRLSSCEGSLVKRTRLVGCGWFVGPAMDAETYHAGRTANSGRAEGNFVGKRRLMSGTGTLGGAEWLKPSGGRHASPWSVACSVLRVCDGLWTLLSTPPVLGARYSAMWRGNKTSITFARRVD